MSAHKITVYSDGSSGGAAKGAIGWGWIAVDWELGEVIAAGSGAEPTGTNNAAELQGAIDGIRHLVEKGLHHGNVIELCSDSTYVLGLATGNFEPQANLERASEIRRLAILTKLHTKWIRGHSGDIFNDKADELAKAARDKLAPDKGARRRHRRRELRRHKRAMVKAYLRGDLWRPPLTHH